MIGRLHHLGIASRNIEKDVVFFQSLGYQVEGSPVVDTVVGIRVQFMKCEGQPPLELVQNLEKEGPISPHLQARRKVFHIAYTSDDIETDVKKQIAECSAVLLCPVSNTNVSDISRWCYLSCRNMLVLELVETRNCK